MILYIFIILLIIILFYYFSSRNTEHLTNTDISNIDIGAIKTLSNIAKKLMG